MKVPGCCKLQIQGKCLKGLLTLPEVLLAREHILKAGNPAFNNY
jgi:hypothetical protein